MLQSGRLHLLNKRLEWADSSQSSALSQAGHSAWTRCTCAQGAAYAVGLLVSEHCIWTMRHLCGTPQASLAWVLKSSTVIIICTCKTYLFREYFCWDCLTIYEVKKIHQIISLQRVLESLIKCSQSRERFWAVHALEQWFLLPPHHVLAVSGLSPSNCCLLNSI